VPNMVKIALSVWAGRIPNLSSHLGYPLFDKTPILQQASINVSAVNIYEYAFRRFGRRC